MSNPRVRGNCPACGASSLFLGDGGYVTCSRVDCPTPDAATLILDDAAPAHVVKIERNGFSIKHPLIERVDDDLLECRLHTHLARVESAPITPGTYRVSTDPEGIPIAWEEV